MELYPEINSVVWRHRKASFFLNLPYGHFNLPMHPLTPLELPPREFARKLRACENLVFYSIIHSKKTNSNIFYWQIFCIWVQIYISMSTSFSFSSAFILGFIALWTVNFGPSTYGRLTFQFLICRRTCFLFWRQHIFLISIECLLMNLFFPIWICRFDHHQVSKLLCFRENQILWVWNACIPYHT